MLDLITGQPGFGKTCMAVTIIEELRKSSGRAVYYNGIKELKLPWIALDDPKQWMSVPDGSIVVLDEAQETFRPRSFSSTVPDYVAKLETHRHHGLDIFLITQHPMLVDLNVRRLVNRHRHLIRPFWGRKAIVHMFQGTRENCDKFAGRRDSMRSTFRYPKKTFGLYKSAEVHTHKAVIPREFFMVVGLVALIGACVWGFYRYGAGMFGGGPSAAPGHSGKILTNGLPAPVNGQTKVLTYAEKKKQYLEDRQSIIPGLGFTAPVYADITKPKAAPVPAMCVKMGARCQCYSQQGTKLPDVYPQLCEDIVANGFFQEFDPGGVRPVVANGPVEPPTKRAAASEVPGGVTVIPDQVTGSLKLSPSPAPNGGGPSTNPRINPDVRPQ